MSKITSYYADYQTFPTLFELEPVAGFEDADDCDRWYHLTLHLSGTSDGFYRKINVAPGKFGPIGQLLRRIALRLYIMHLKKITDDFFGYNTVDKTA